MLEPFAQHSSCRGSLDARSKLLSNNLQFSSHTCNGTRAHKRTAPFLGTMLLIAESSFQKPPCAAASSAPMVGDCRRFAWHSVVTTLPAHPKLVDQRTPLQQHSSPHENWKTLAVQNVAGFTMYSPTAFLPHYWGARVQTGAVWVDVASPTLRSDRLSCYCFIQTETQTLLSAASHGQQQCGLAATLPPQMFTIARYACL